MRRRNRRRGSPRSGRLWTKLLAVSAVIFVLLILVHMRLRPIVESMAGYQAKVFAARIVNQAMMDELEDSRISYGDLVYITQNSDGMITSIQADMMNINRLKSFMAGRVLRDLLELREQSIYVPLGTLLGNEWFSGRGPDIEVRVIPIGYLQSEIYNQFQSAGINQTNHRIMLRITVRMRVLVPGYHIEIDSSSEFCIAETVIVGQIPDTYLQFSGDSAPFLASIDDAVRQ